MKTIAFAAASLLLITACSEHSSTPTSNPKAALDSLFKNYREAYVKLYPIDATSAGDNRYNDLLPNSLTTDFRNQVKDFYTSYRDQLQAIDRSKLSENDQISYDVLQWECNINLEGLQFKDYLMPLNQFWSMPLTIGQLATGTSAQPFKTVKDYDNWLARLNAYVVYCDTAITNMRKGMALHYVLPKALTLKVIPQMTALDHGPIADHLFYSPVKNMPADFSQDDKARLIDAYQKMIGDKIIPLYKRLADFLQNEYLPACRASSGIDSIPDGKAYYAHLIKLFTTTNKSADEIFDLGQSEVSRITAEMEKVKDQVGFKGDLKSFFVHLRSMKQLTPYTTQKQVLDHFEEIHERMKPYLVKLFDKTPKTGFEIRETEAFREASASAEYNPGSKDGSRPGIFYVPIPDAKKYNVLEDEDLFLHEAIPGHHYQISLQMENDSLPEFRQTLFYSAYGEGWALYSESLGKDLGLYTDPYQYFGMLSDEMHRAIRLVVDAGMHAKGWTREQAIQYSLDHEAEPEASIIAEIERYMAIPGQALSYKIGQLKILELRDKAEKALGDKFNIAEFHDQVLETGCVPLEVLEAKVERWIAQKQNPASI